MKPQSELMETISNVLKLFLSCVCITNFFAIAQERVLLKQFLSYIYHGYLYQQARFFSKLPTPQFSSSFSKIWISLCTTALQATCLLEKNNVTFDASICLFHCCCTLNFKIKSTYRNTWILSRSRNTNGFSYCQLHKLDRLAWYLWYFYLEKNANKNKTF